ncbi:hypothetical protein CRYUN_Cryun05aG0215800 [Craigia yunnanensis]
MVGSSTSPPQPALCSPDITTVDQNTVEAISTIHPDIIETHILTRLDGPTLASASCASSHLRALTSQENLWTNICHSAWPSTTSPRIRHVISNFPNGSRSFFSDAFPLTMEPRELRKLGYGGRHGAELDRDRPDRKTGDESLESKTGDRTPALAERGGAGEVRVVSGRRGEWGRDGVGAVRGGGHVRRVGNRGNAPEGGKFADGGHEWDVFEWEG